jgi:hypothetical protein
MLCAVAQAFMMLQLGTWVGTARWRPRLLLLLRLWQLLCHQGLLVCCKGSLAVPMLSQEACKLLQQLLGGGSGNLQQPLVRACIA